MFVKRRKPLEFAWALVQPNDNESARETLSRGKESHWRIQMRPDSIQSRASLLGAVSVVRAVELRTLPLQKLGELLESQRML